MGYDFVLKRSGVGVTTVSSWIAINILAGGKVFLAPLPLDLLSHLKCIQ